jgi:hypothetical protein
MARPTQGRGVRRFVDHQYADHHEGKGAAENVGERASDRLALLQSTSETQRDRHTHDEKKGGEDQVDEGHAAAFGVAVAEMNHGIGHDMSRAREVVHEDHQEHHEPAQGVHRRDPWRVRRFGSRSWIVGHRRQPCRRPCRRASEMGIAWLGEGEEMLECRWCCVSAAVPSAGGGLRWRGFDPPRLVRRIR